MTTHIHITSTWYREFRKDLVAVSIIWLLLQVAVAWFTPHDSTDPSGGRSGLRPYTAAATGCQYLSDAQGGITPRFDTHGHQLCSSVEGGQP